MPDNDSNLTALRASGHKVRLYFGKFNGSVVWTATVDSTPTDKALNLTVTGVSGSSSDVKRGFMVRVETAGGAFKGATNVRAAGTISSTSLPIHELPQADIAIVATDVIKVYNVPYLGDKLPVDAEGFAPDNLTYSDQGTAVPPRVNSGGHFIGFVDSGQTYATVATRGNLSTAEDPDSAGTITHVWTLLTGTLAFAPGSSSTDENPTIRASVGYGIAEHAVTDSANSKSWTQFVCFQVYDANTQPYRLIDGDLSADEQNGWSGTFQTYANSTLTDLFDGQFVGVFARETINGTDTSYGTDIPNRAHIKLLGFLHHDENALEPQLRRVTFSIQSPWQRLAGLPGFSKVFTRSASDFTLIDDLTIRLAILHLLRYYTFYMEFFDVRFDSAFLNKAYPKLYLNKQTADKQILELADGVDARATCLRTGELLFHTHPAYIPLSSRSSITSTLTISEQDCITAPFTRDHWKSIETFELRGFLAGTTEAASTPVFSRYPSLTPGRGAQSIAAERIIADDQTDANNRCGRRGALVDGVFKTSTNVQYRAVEWDVTLPGSYDVFDFNKEYIETTLGTSTNLRGVDLSALQFYLTRIRITYSGGTARVNPTFATATNAPAGSTYIPATEDSPPYTPPDYVPTPLPDPRPTIPPEVLDLFPAKILLFSTAHPYVAMATAYSIDTGMGTITFTWEDRSGNLASLGAGYTTYKYANPFHYQQYHLLTDIGLVTVPTLDDPSPTYTLKQTNASLFSSNVGHAAFGSHLVSGWGIALCGKTGAAVTFDDWATFTQVGIDGAAAQFTPPTFNEGIGRVSVWLCGHDPNHLYGTYLTGNSGSPGGGQLTHVCKSTDGGLTWTNVSAVTSAYTISGGAHVINRSQSSVSIPYKKPGGAVNRDNGSLFIELVSSWFDSGGNFIGGARVRSTDGFINNSSVSTQPNSPYASRQINGIAYYTHDADYNHVATVTSGYTYHNVVSTSDDGSNYNVPASPGLATNPIIEGWVNPQIVFMFDNGASSPGSFKMSLDEGVTWYTCNLPTSLGWASNEPCIGEGCLFSVAGMPQ